MADLVWEWNGTDVSQFSAGSDIRITNSEPSGSGVSDTTTHLGENALRISIDAGGLRSGGRTFVINDIPTLPDRYVVTYRMVSASLGPTTGTAYGMILPIWSDGGNGFGITHGGAATSYSIINTSRSNATGGGGTIFTQQDYETGGLVYRHLVHHRPDNHVSGSFSVTTNYFKYNGTRGLESVQNAGTQFGEGAVNASGGLAGVSSNRVGIAMFNNSAGAFHSGSFIIKDFRIYAHPDDLSFYTF